MDIKYLKLVSVFVVFLAMFSACKNQNKTNHQGFDTEENRPNILILFTDDQRYGTINALNQDTLKTPNLDKLVKNGTYFNNAYIFGAPHGAVCSPSRAMLMTGRPYFNIPENTYATWEYPPEERGNSNLITFPEHLKNNGYQTFTTGKQHNGNYWIERGFNVVKSAFLGGMSTHFGTPVKDFDAKTGWSETQTYSNTFSAEVFANAAVDYLNQYNKKEPFLMYVSFTSPHDPRTAPQEYHDMYPAKTNNLPPNFMPQHPFSIADMHIRDEKLAAFPRKKEEVKKHIADYYAMITATDAQMGRILDALEATGKAKNTIIIFASDNGLAVGQHGLMGKQSVYEHSIKVPLCVVGPNIPKQKQHNGLVYIHDIFPTLCDVLGLPVPASVQSKSLMPIINGDTTTVHKAMHFGYNSWRKENNRGYPEGTSPKGAHRAVREGDWKLILSSKNQVLTKQLFNLKTDPWELTNLAENPDYKAKVESLTEQLKLLITQTGDPAQLEKPYFGLLENDDLSQ